MSVNEPANQMTNQAPDAQTGEGTARMVGPTSTPSMGIYAMRDLAPLGPVQEAEEALSIRAPEVLAKYTAAKRDLGKRVGSLREMFVAGGHERVTAELAAAVEQENELERQMIAAAQVLEQGGTPEIPSFATTTQLTGQELLDEFRRSASPTRCGLCDSAWDPDLPYCRACRTLKGSRGLEFLVDRFQLGSSQVEWDAVTLTFDAEGFTVVSPKNGVLCRVPFAGIAKIEYARRTKRIGLFKKAPSHIGLRIVCPELAEASERAWVDFLYAQGHPVAPNQLDPGVAALLHLQNRFIDAGCETPRPQ